MNTRSAIVLAPDPKRLPRAWRAQFGAGHSRLASAVAADDAARCSAVFVYNDHSTMSVRLLRQALSLRNRRPNLPIAVFTPLADARGVEALVAGMSAPGPDRVIASTQLPAVFEEDLDYVQARFGNDAISFVFEA